MITKNDLESAIAECQGKRDPDSRTCIMLAAFLTIKRELFEEEKNDGYSFAPAPVRNVIEIDSDSEFARAIDGKDQKEVLPILDELMATLNVIQPRLYDAVMDRLT